MSQKSGVIVPKIATLDGFIEAVEKNNGLDVSSLPAGTTLLIETRNSHYQLIILDPAKRSVKVSSFDSKVIRKQLDGIMNGSTFRGSMIKLGWIGVGMCLEIHMADGRTLTTSMVKKISLVSFTQLSNMVH